MMHLHYAMITQWLHLHPQWGGVAAFIIAFAESIAIIGTIIPGSVTMTAIGILAGSGVLPIWSVILFAISGAIIGDGCSYFLGYYLKDNLQNIWPFRRHPGIFSSGETFFDKHGALSVFIGRFVGPVRAIIPLIAGMLNMRPKYYFLASIPSAIIWAPLYMLPGFLLGAASLEMSTEMATQLIISVLVLLVVFWLVIKATGYVYDKTHAYFSRVLDHKWEIWSKQPSKKWFCTLLHHAGRPNKRGQLILAINCLLALVAFIIIFINVGLHGPLTAWNDPIYHLLRGFRTPTLNKVFVVITIFGYKYIPLSLLFTVSMWLIVRRRWLSAIHWFMGNSIAITLLWIFKHGYFSARPSGIFQQVTTSSFPSGHTALSVVFYGLLAFFIGLSLSKRWRKTIYWVASIFCFAVGLSRLYLGAHWFTDVLGGLFLGLFVLSATVISYRRFKSDNPHWLGLLSVSIITLAIAMGITFSVGYQKILKHSEPFWPTQKISETVWWHQHSNLLPLYRKNRLGKPVELLNVQWTGSLEQLKTMLKLENWHNPHTRGYITTLKTLARQDATKHQELLPTLYNDQRPVLELIKFVGKQSPPLILRLWQSNIILMPNNKPLWVGTIYYDVQQHHLFFFKTKTTPIHIEEAAKALIPSLVDFTWHMQIIQPKDLPEDLAKRFIVDRVIVIKPTDMH